MIIPFLLKKNDQTNYLLINDQIQSFFLASWITFYKHNITLFELSFSFFQFHIFL